MLKLKQIFKKEEQRVDISEKIQKDRDVKSKLDAVFKDKNNKVCKMCESPILDTENYSKKGNYFWHKPCWNKAKKMATQSGHI